MILIEKQPFFMCRIGTLDLQLGFFDLHIGLKGF